MIKIDAPYDERQQEKIKQTDITNQYLIDLIEEIGFADKNKRSAMLHDLYHQTMDDSDSLDADYMQQVASILLQADSSMNLHAGTLLKIAQRKLQSQREERRVITNPVHNVAMNIIPKE